ncbi:uncharacterized protein CHSO_0384 [Chryseobacterium sp. StRB126]|uniref:hypothetical protein n=1 Tax=Chryseobacterium sp. StRB126 TaxID=878220 RepID=UPI0004E981FF|nr:hypothetical protein [Chryseobacterium sp. StRB126]BAP29421.1 uncharacterized protein CHSO_0384 [Chryseobacterium sp. StRB126]
MFFILLFLFSGVRAQTLIITNNIGIPIIVKNGKKEVTLNNQGKKEFTETNRIEIKISDNKFRYINLFLDPIDKLKITMGKNNEMIYSGDKAALHKYLTETLNVDTFGKINTYELISQKKNSGELKNISELLLLDILKKVQLSNIVISPEDKISTRSLKNYIKYNWLSTIFSTVDRRETAFKKDVINYYFKKYIETDISRFSCTTSLPYSVIEVLAKNKSLLQTELPIYPIVEHTDDDNINQYLPQNCQKQYFQQKYNYLEHINGHNKEYYKKVLREKFNEE